MRFLISTEPHNLMGSVGFECIRNMGSVTLALSIYRNDGVLLACKWLCVATTTAAIAEIMIRIVVGNSGMTFVPMISIDVTSLLYSKVNLV